MTIETSSFMVIKAIGRRNSRLNSYHGGDNMIIIDYLLPYNNFIVFFCLVILNIVLIFKRSYWQTFLIANLLLIAFLILIGFDPIQTATDVVNKMVDFFKNVLKDLWQDIIGSIF